MRKLILFALLFLSLHGYAQGTTDKLLSSFDRKIFTFHETVETGQKYLLISFQNNEYSYITDIGTITLQDSSEVIQFKNDLYTTFGLDGSSNTYTIKRSNYTMEGHNNHVYVTNSEGKYFVMPNGFTFKLIKWLNTLQF